MGQHPIVLAGAWRGDKRRSLERHQNEGLEIVLIAGGQSTWEVQGRVEQVLPGSVFFTLPWQTHGSVLSQEPGLELYYAVIHLDKAYHHRPSRIRFDSGIALTQGFERRLSGALLRSRRHSLAGTPGMRWILPRLVEEANRREAAVDAVAGLCRLALVELERCVAGAASANCATSPAMARVRRFIARLPECSDERWKLDEMAARCGLSRTRFAELTRHLTGESPISLLNRVRIDRAKRMLVEADRSITQIGHAAGFDSSQYFARVFKTYAGCSPRQWREAGRHK